MIRPLMLLALFFLSGFLLSAQEFKFGAMADIQYADKNDFTYKPWRSRHYRTSIEMLEKSIDFLNESKPLFVIQLGDVVDGQDSPDKNLEDYKKVYAVLDRLNAPLYNTVGNHCMTLGTEKLKELLKKDKFYYDFTLQGAPGWRFVVLDGSDGGRWTMSKEQIKWFAEVLEKSKRDSEKVICFCHFPLVHQISFEHRLANHDALFDVLDKSGANVVAWISGHYHPGGYAFRNGVHNVSVKGMVEAKTNSTAVFEVYKDEIKEKGFGDEPSRTLPFGKPAN